MDEGHTEPQFACDEVDGRQDPDCRQIFCPFLHDSTLWWPVGNCFVLTRIMGGWLPVFEKRQVTKGLIPHSGVQRVSNILFAEAFQGTVSQFAEFAIQVMLASEKGQ